MINKKIIIAASILTVLPAALSAQTALDAYSISQSDLRGTARFMSMGGAFTALGGDISSLNQNPGGIGVYRSSEISATLDINFHNAELSSPGAKTTHGFTSVACNNFGYVGSANLGSNSAMPFFNWGASYSRVASFDRRYRGSLGAIGGSYSNFLADMANRDGYYPDDLLAGGGYNPYQDPYYQGQYAAWPAILGFNAYLFSPVSPNSTSYSGLFDYGRDGNPVSSGLADIEVNEKGYIDEYSLNFGGNIENIVYWGIGFGITDLSFTSESYYSESLDNANVPSASGETYVRAGEADFTLGNYKHIWGSGFNFKAGLIIKPVNEFRIGVAVHTPTYYNLSYEGSGRISYRYNSSSYPSGQNYRGNVITDEGYLDYFDWQLKSPWRLMVGVAGVLGSKAIISADYEYRAVNNMTIKDFRGNTWQNETDDVNTYYKASNILRLGAEYRVTPQFSIRAGYSYETSPVQSDVMRGYNQTANGIQATYMYTAGPDDTETQPSFTLDKQTQYASLGLGYKYKNFYADAAYVYRHRSSKFAAYTNYNDVDGWYNEAPTAEVKNNNNSIVLTLGFRF